MYLVGAGPGDPDLVTVKAAKILAAADVVLYDRLVNPAVLRYLSDRASAEFVGKRPGGQSMSQPAINRRLILLARHHRTVVRLKGGDPFVLGRGGEEVASLAKAGIAVHLVPGISSAWAAPALAGIPLTFRDTASGFIVLSGHHPDSLAWPALVASQCTLVFLMGVATVTQLVSNLMAHGMAAGTPAAIIERASFPEERQAVTTLTNLPTAMAEKNIQSPAVIVIGRVVGTLPAMSGGTWTPPHGRLPRW